MLVLGLVHCPGGGGGGGGGAGTANDAILTITLMGGTAVAVEHDTARTEITVTPPVDRQFTTNFVSSDPSINLAIRINGRVVQEGERISFPVTGSRTSNDVKISVEYGGKTYSSTGGNADGSLDVTILRVNEDSLDFRGNFAVTLVAEDGTGQSLAADGFLEVHFGDASLSTDAGF